MGRDPHRVGIGAMVPKSTPPRTSLERFLEPLPRTSSSHLFLVLNLRRILRGLKSGPLLITILRPLKQLKALTSDLSDLCG